MDHFKAMRTFVQVADVGSFVGASRAMDISPAVVTRVVAELEDDLGARLLTRTTRRVALTDIGRHFLERTRGILRDLDETLAVARRSHQVARGPVRLRASRLSRPVRSRGACRASWQRTRRSGSNSMPAARSMTSTRRTT
jgi:DNA-binding transcriptional LysR family regulator